MAPTMLIGHYAPALALKAARPSTPLWILFVGVQLVDFAWASFILTGLEAATIIPGHTASNALDLHFMPYSHGLLAAALWALAFGLVVSRLVRRERLAAGVLAGLAVLSHWFLDLVVHTPDLPLVTGDGPKLGLGLWDHQGLSFLLELLLLFAGAALLAWRHRPSRGARFAAFIVGMALLTVASYFGPHPPTIELMAGSALALFTALAFLAYLLVDRSPLPREVTTHRL